jgi:predicted glycosyltransferase
MKTKEKGIFVYSDPGGARAVLAEAFFMKKNGLDVRVYSDRKYSFAKEFGLEVIEPLQSPDTIISEFNPDFIYTGTSYISDIELNFIAAAKKQGIKSIAIIDHWTSMKARFLRRDKLVLPDEIHVIDERAKSICMEEGIDAERIRVTGNPYHQYLKQWKPAEDKETFLEKLGIKDNKKIVVYAPDPLSNVNGKERFGFDEITATAQIGQLLDKNAFHHLYFILKAHPNQNMSKIEMPERENIIVADDTVDSGTLMYYADLVIGFFSNFLLEAALLGKKVLRFHPLPLINDPLKPTSIGKIVDPEGLQLELNNLNGIK